MRDKLVNEERDGREGQPRRGRGRTEEHTNDNKCSAEKLRPSTHQDGEDHEVARGAEDVAVEGLPATLFHVIKVELRDW